MVNDNKIKNIILAVLVIGLVGMTIAYAGLTQQLNITDNKADVKTTWKVLFNNTVTATPTGTATVDTQPTVNGARTQISGLRATFKKPGDKVVMTFKIQNEGNIKNSKNTQINSYICLYENTFDHFSGPAYSCKRSGNGYPPLASSERNISRCKQDSFRLSRRSLHGSCNWRTGDPTHQQSCS